MSEDMGGADLPAPSGPEDYRGAIETIYQAITSVDAPVTYICLGPPTNLAAALETHPSLKEYIGAVYYYGSFLTGRDSRPSGPVKSTALSWNTDRDALSAASVAAADLPLYCCSLPDSLLLVFDKKLFDQVTSFDTPGSKLMERIYSHGKAAELLGERHFRAWDETVVLCLIEPLLAEFERIPQSGDGGREISRLVSFDTEGARSIYLDSFKHAGQSPAETRRTVVFGQFPSDPGIIREDIRPLIGELIDRHGYEEWRAAVLTNELHRHLGIYSLLGVKMGIRAREILGATLDDLEVESYAGLNPPLSCMNDGLQVSTGATLGRGTIRVETSKPHPGAIFIKGDERVRLRLKDSIVAGIKKDIAGAIENYGSLTPEYFAEIRRLSIRYWIEMDRDDLFDITMEQGAVK
jgi:pyrimidine-specific ribonucleoside hydrolase